MCKYPAFQFSIVFFSTVLSLQNYAAEENLEKNNSLPEEEVYVTGSRIASSSANPTHMSYRLTNEALGDGMLLADVLNRIPQSGAPLTSQTTTNFGLFAPGLASVDLRNLSPSRTLVLVNGRRFVGGDNERPSVVDLNSIPAHLVERVEVVTGGVSAIYGSEAVAGVVNIILKDDIDGVTLDAFWGESSEGDGTERALSVTAGTGFGAGAGQITFHAGYSKLEEVASRDRKFSANDEFLGDFQDYSAWTPTGTATADLAFLFTEDENGQWVADYNPVEHGFNRADFRLLQIPLERQDIHLNADYEFSDSLRGFIETSFTKTESMSQIEPTVAGVFGFTDGNSHFIATDNPIVPAELVTTMTNLYGFDPGLISFTRRMNELGPQISEQTRETKRWAIGLSGNMGEWEWDSYYQHGRSTRDQQNYGQYDTLNLQNGLDVEADPDNPGAFRCLSQTARNVGCVPIDVFGAGSISAAALDYIRINSVDKSEIDQQVFAASIKGQVDGVLPAGPVDLVAGFEWRDESLRTTPDPRTFNNTSGNFISDVDGSYHVHELFVESRLPFVGSLNSDNYFGMDAAYRYANYSRSDTNGSWQLGFDYIANDQFRFRSVFAESVRAPNIAEIFDQGTRTFVSFADPCTAGGVGGPGNTEANCASLGLGTDYDPGVLGTEASGIFSGNSALTEEKAKTFTLGTVMTPTNNLVIALDYFNIEVEDAIEAIDPSIKLAQCYAAADFLNNPSCDGIIRSDASQNFVITNIDFEWQNIAVLETQGWDLALQYSVDALGGTFEFDSVITRTNEWKQRVNGGTFSKLGEPGFQEWKGNTHLQYRTGPISLSWMTRYLGHGVVDNQLTTDVWPKNDDLPSVWYHDFDVRYALGRGQESGGNNHYVFYAGLRNAFDKQPPYIPSPSLNNIPGTNTAAGVYDVVGRFVYAGVEVSF